MSSCLSLSDAALSLLASYLTGLSTCAWYVDDNMGHVNWSEIKEPCDILWFPSSAVSANDLCFSSHHPPPFQLSPGNRAEDEKVLWSIKNFGKMFFVTYLLFGWVLAFKNKIYWRFPLACCRCYLFEKLFVTEMQSREGSTWWSLCCSGVEEHICWEASNLIVFPSWHYSFLHVFDFSFSSWDIFVFFTFVLSVFLPSWCDGNLEIPEAGNTKVI